MATVLLLWIQSIRFYSLQTVNKLIKHWRRHFNVLKESDHSLCIAGLCCCYLKRRLYWVKDDNSRHQREKIAPIFHKCLLQRKLNNSEKIFVDNREPQCKYLKLPLVSHKYLKLPLVSPPHHHPHPHPSYMTICL